MGRFSWAASQLAFESLSGSPWVSVTKRTSPLTKLRRMMRAWLASAEADGTPRRSATKRISKWERNSLREVIIHPLMGKLAKTLDGQKAWLVAYSSPKEDGLAWGDWRQAKNGSRL